MTAVAPTPITTELYPACDSKCGSFIGRMPKTTDPTDIEVRSERSAFELRFPHMASRMSFEAYRGGGHATPGEVAAHAAGGEGLPGTDLRDR